MFTELNKSEEWKDRTSSIIHAARNAVWAFQTAGTGRAHGRPRSPSPIPVPKRSFFTSLLFLLPSPQNPSGDDGPQAPRVAVAVAAAGNASDRKSVV